MSAHLDLEKGQDLDDETNATNSTIEEKYTAEGAIGQPDADHEEVEQMDTGHMDDLELQHVSPSHYLPLTHIANLTRLTYP